jgi:hypothetical protein
MRSYRSVVEEAAPVPIQEERYGEILTSYSLEEDEGERDSRCLASCNPILVRGTCSEIRG